MSVLRNTPRCLPSSKANPTLDVSFKFNTRNVKNILPRFVSIFLSTVPPASHYTDWQFWQWICIRGYCGWMEPNKKQITNKSCQAYVRNAKLSFQADVNNQDVDIYISRKIFLELTSFLRFWCPSVVCYSLMLSWYFIYSTIIESWKDVRIFR